MKKINWKAVLIVLLVLLLAVALVACNGNKDDNKKGPSTNTPKPTGNSSPEAFFDGLWDIASGIGSEAVASTDDLAVSVDLEVELGTKARAGTNQGKIQQSIKLGFAIDAVLDRTHMSEETFAQNTSAVRIAIRSGSVNIATLYYFLEDSESIYIDFDGQNIKFNIKLAEINKNLAKYLKKGLGIGSPTGYLEKYLTPFTSTMGEDWTLDNLVDGLLSMLNINISDMLGDILNNDSFASIFSTLKIDKDALLDDQGHLRVLPVLRSETVTGILGMAFNKNAVTGGDEYKATLKFDGVVGMALGFIPKVLGGSITSVLGKDTELNIYYVKDSNESVVDGVHLDLWLKDLTATVGDGRMSVAPYVNIGIKHLNIRKATAENKVKTATDKANYSDKLAINLTETLEVKGFAVDTNGFSEDTKVFDATGEIQLGVKGVLDLSGDPEVSPVTANAWLSYNDEKILMVSMIDDRLAVQIDRSVSLKYKATKDAEAFDQEFRILDNIVAGAGKDIYDFIYGLLKDEQKPIAEGIADVLFDKSSGNIDYTKINPNFKGIVLEGINIRKGFQDQAAKWFGDVEGWANKTASSQQSANGSAEGEAVASADDKSLTLGNIVDIVKQLLPLITAEDGKLSIDSSLSSVKGDDKSILQLVSTIGNLLKAKDETTWTVAGCIEECVKFFNNSIVNDGAETVKNTLHALNKIREKNTGVAIPSKGSNKPTAENLAKELFNADKSHEYSESTCTGDDHKDCKAHYDALLKVTKDLLENTKKATEYEHFFDALEKVRATYAANASDKDFSFGKEQTEAITKELFNAYYGHQYSKDDCKVKGKDETHKNCADNYNKISSLIGYAKTLNGLLDKLNANNEEHPDKTWEFYVDKFASTQVLNDVFEKIAKTLLMDGVKEYDPADSAWSDDYRTSLQHILKALLTKLEAKIDIDFTDGMKLDVHIGFGSDVAINLHHDLQIVKVETGDIVDYSTGYKTGDAAAEGWYVYNFAA